MALLKRFIFFSPGPSYNWRKVFCLLAFSLIFTTGSFFLGHLFLEGLKNFIEKNRSGHIRAILQNSKNGKIASEYFAEFFALCKDKPTFLHHFDTKLAEKRLLSVPIFKWVVVKKIKPDQLYIEYSLRSPIAYVENLTNIAIDEEGIFFPYLPFLYPRKLPNIYLGGIFQKSTFFEPTISLQTSLKEIASPLFLSDLSKEEPFLFSLISQNASESEALADLEENLNVKAFDNTQCFQLEKKSLEIIKNIFEKFEASEIKRLDLSCIDCQSVGKRQIILVLQSEKTLRLTENNYQKELANYFILEQTLLKDDIGPMVIDLRTDEVAYIDQPLSH